MPRSWGSSNYDFITGKKIKKRKAFKISTKKIEWERAGSKCRECRMALKWGSGRYEFHHKNGNEADINQKNCWLICKNCHGEITKKQVKRVKTRDMLGYSKTKVVKRKVRTKAMKKVSRKLKKSTTGTKKKITKKKKKKKQDPFGLGRFDFGGL